MFDWLYLTVELVRAPALGNHDHHRHPLGIGAGLAVPRNKRFSFRLSRCTMAAPRSGSSCRYQNPDGRSHLPRDGSRHTSHEHAPHGNRALALFVILRRRSGASRRSFDKRKRANRAQRTLDRATRQRNPDEIPSGNREAAQSFLPRKRGIPPFGSRQKPSLYLRGILLVRWHRQNAYHAYLPQIRCPQSTSFHRPSSERDRGARHAQWTPKRIAPKLKRAAGTDAKRCPRIGSHDKISFGELALGSSRPGLMSCIRPGIQSNPSKIASKIATACHLGTANEDVLRRNYAAALARVDILAPIA